MFLVDRMVNLEKMASTVRLLSLLEDPASHQLVGRVTAYQGSDG